MDMNAQISAVLLLMQLQLTTVEPPGTGTPQPSAFTRCLEFQQSLRDPVRPTREHRHGWYYRLAEKADALSQRRIPVRGGLLPTPNIAAQAGAIDPTVAANALTAGDQQRQQFSRKSLPVLQLRTIGPSCR
jgi:hypothetical protein